MWLLAFTKLFAWLVCRVVGLFTLRGEAKQERDLCTQAKVIEFGFTFVILSSTMLAQAA